MPEVFVPKRHSAQDQTDLPQKPSSRSEAAAGICVDSKLFREWRPQDLSASESAYHLTDWIKEAFPLVVSATIFAESAFDQKIFLSGTQVRFIHNVREDLDQYDEAVQRSLAAQLCLKFAEGLGLELANHPRIRVAAFADEEEHTVTLVAHHRAGKRQTSFEFQGDGRTIDIIRIDEQMERSEQRCELRHSQPLREAIAWLSCSP